MSIPATTTSDEQMSIAEFHDIGKIVNWHALGLQRRRDNGKLKEEPHDFEKCIDPEWGVDFTVPLWRAIFRKDDKVDDHNVKINEIRRQHFPDSRDWFIVSLADGACGQYAAPSREGGRRTVDLWAPLSVDRQNRTRLAPQTN